MSKSKDSGATGGVMDYLKKQNRPYSLVDIVTNLHNQFGKAAIQRSLDQLVTEGKVREKTYGKQKVYVIDQKMFPIADEKELKAMDLKISELTQLLKTSQDRLKTLEIKYASLNSELSMTEIEKQLEKYSTEIKKLSAKLDQLRSNTNVISPEEKDKIIQNHKKYVTAWKKRKMIVNEMLNGILESYPANKKALCEEIGVELDEDVGAIFPK
uniref:Homologous-pairing protein 2 homolog n=1 Tax=Strigamia maritima TaxID=126957 RepID=T1J701_STRMM